jgi:hypothetical protein
MNNKIEKKQEILDQIKYWKEYKPVNGLGKWYVQVRLDKLYKKLERYENKS